MKPHAPGSVSSLVCGILALFTWPLPLFAGPLALLALLQAWRASVAGRAEPLTYAESGVATAGKVTGSLALVFTLVAAFGYFLVLSAVGAALDDHETSTHHHKEKNKPAASAPLLW